MWNTSWLKLSKHGDLLRFSILTSLYIQYFSVSGGCGLDKTFEVFFFYFLELYWLNNYFISWENLGFFGCWRPQSPLFIVTYFSLTYPSLWYWGFRLSILLVKLMYSFPCPALGSSIYCTRQSHLEEVLWFFVCVWEREKEKESKRLRKALFFFCGQISNSIWWALEKDRYECVQIQTESLLHPPSSSFSFSPLLVVGVWRHMVISFPPPSCSNSLFLSSQHVGISITEKEYF